VDALHSMAQKCDTAGGGIIATLSSDSEWLRSCMRRAYQSVGTYVSRLDGVMALYNHAPRGTVKGGHKVQAFWRAELRDAQATLSAQRKNNVMTEKLRQNTLYLHELDTALRDMSAPAGATEIMQRLWLTIARHLPPKRLDYGRMRILRRASDRVAGENAIFVPDKKGDIVIIFDAFKTKGKYNT
jgi:hypothetical protein